MATPKWFKDAISTTFTHENVNVPNDDGTPCNIHYLHYNRGSNKPGIVLVHGGQAHAHWWSHIAPLLLDKYQVVALDMSGNGDSGWRRRYSLLKNVEEVFAVATNAGFPSFPKPVLVGHSFGGWVSMLLGHDADRASFFCGIVVVDSPVRTKNMLKHWRKREKADSFRYDTSENEWKGPLRRPRFFAERDTLLGRFNLRPPQECANGFIVDHIARHSVRRWKHDEASVASNTTIDWKGYMGRQPGANPLVENAVTYENVDETVNTPSSLRGEKEVDVWAWKFDPGLMTMNKNIVNGKDDESQLDMFSNSLSRVKNRCILFIGSRSIFFQPENEISRHTKKQSELQKKNSGGYGACPIVTLPDCAHHIMLDAPLTFVAALRTTLAEWERFDAIVSTNNSGTVRQQVSARL